MLDLFKRKRKDKTKSVIQDWNLVDDIGLPIDVSKTYWVYATGITPNYSVAFINKQGIVYDECGEEITGIVAWIVLPRYNKEK